MNRVDSATILGDGGEDGSNVKRDADTDTDRPASDHTSNVNRPGGGEHGSGGSTSSSESDDNDGLSASASRFGGSFAAGGDVSAPVIEGLRTAGSEVLQTLSAVATSADGRTIASSLASIADSLAALAKTMPPGMRPGQGLGAAAAAAAPASAGPAVPTGVHPDASSGTPALSKPTAGGAYLPRRAGHAYAPSHGRVRTPATRSRPTRSMRTKYVSASPSSSGSGSGSRSESSSPSRTTSPSERSSSADSSSSSTASGSTSSAARSADSTSS